MANHPLRFASAALMLLLTTSGCQTTPQAKEAKHLQRGEALMAKQDYSRAMLEFRNAATVMPKDAEPHYRVVVHEEDSRRGVCNGTHRAGLAVNRRLLRRWLV